MNLFSLEHCALLLTTLVIATFFGCAQRLNLSSPTRRVMERGLFGVLFVNEFWWFMFRHFHLGIPLKDNLPLHLCDFAIFMTFGSVLFQSKRLWELTYFVGTSAGLMAVVLPNISEKGAIQWIATLRFFLTHMLILAAGFYFTVGSGFRITYESLIRSFLFVHAYALAVGIVNGFLDTNYFYVFERPSVLKFLPEMSYGQYLLGFSGAYVIVFHLLYLPWMFKTRLGNQSVG